MFEQVAGLLVDLERPDSIKPVDIEPVHTRSVLQPVTNDYCKRQVNDLRSRMDAIEQLAHANKARADKSELHADDSATRADAAEARTDAGELRSEDDHRRVTDIEGRLDVHEEMITELQAEGLISSECAAHLRLALETARTIGAAIGIVMTLYRVNESVAFGILKKASMHDNRKLRLLAEEVVQTGRVPGLPPR